MNYYINPSALSAVFTVPCSAVDNGLKLASEGQLRVLLYVMRNLAEGINFEKTAQALGMSESEVGDCLLYWEQAGIFKSDSAKEPNGEKSGETAEKAAVRQALKPTRADVARRGSEDPQVCFLMREAQQRFGRNLKTNESTTLLWLYDDQGMDISVILMLLQYAASAERLNVSFIEKTAVEWLKSGVENVKDAEEQIAQSVRKNTAWHMVEAAFGITPRKPSKNELEKSDIWLNEWNIGRELLAAAYNACVDRKSEFSFAYTSKIIEDWHKRGITTPQSAEEDAARFAAGNKENKKRTAGKEAGRTSYRIEDFEKMLDNEDE